MRDYHGIILAYSANPKLRELVSSRTTSSLPFCGRYRVIDFALSSLRNAGIFDVGVIMQRDYQSLLNHLGSGKPWDMSRRVGGLQILPPFGLPGNHNGQYSGSIEALNAVSSYIKDIPQNNIILLNGDICANLDLDEVIEKFEASEAPALALCAEHASVGLHHRYMLDKEGFVEKIIFDRENDDEISYPSLGCYIIRKDVLLSYMDKCKASNVYRFHKDAVSMYLNDSNKMAVYIHPGYSSTISSVETYYRTNMDMLNPETRKSLFVNQRPIRTKCHEEVSTYYGENAVSRWSLVADNCIIEGEIENCVIFSGVRIAPGVKLKNCIVMQNCNIPEGCRLDCVIVDKNVTFPGGTVLTGTPSLPVVVPKNYEI